jgi:hypothetical protein
MRWSSSACCTARATSPRSPSTEDSPNDRGCRAPDSAHLTLPLRGPLPLRPKGGEGTLVQFSSDDFEHAGEIMHDVIVPEAEDSVAAAPDLQGAGSVFLRLLRVSETVELDRKLATGTGEIDDIRSDPMLPPKPVLGRKLAQSQPHLLLGFRRSPPQPPCNPCSTFQRQAISDAPYLPLCPSGAERAGVRWGDCRAPVTDDNPSGRRYRYAESPGAGGHTSVESNECCLQSLSDRDVDRIWSTKVDIKTPQNPICCVDIGGRDLLPACRSCDPCIEIGECNLPVFPREVARPHTPPDGRRELGDAEITDYDKIRVCRKRPRRERSKGR